SRMTRPGRSRWPSVRVGSLAALGGHLGNVGKKGVAGGVGVARIKNLIATGEPAPTRGFLANEDLGGGELCVDLPERGQQAVALFHNTGTLADKKRFHELVKVGV